MASFSALEGKYSATSATYRTDAITSRVRKCHYLFRDFSSLYCANVIDINVACRMSQSNHSTNCEYFKAPTMKGYPY